MHKVKCKYCEQIFDRDKIPFIQISANRYAHKECAEEYGAEKTKEQQDLEKLELYIQKLFDEPYVNARIRKQIKDYRQQYNYTYSGMLKTLIWWFDIKGNSIEKSNGGIGIIPFVYKDAYNYFYSLYLAKIANENKNVNDFISSVKEITIESPRVYIKPHRLFNLEENNE